VDVPVPMITVQGLFFRAIRADRLAEVLAPPGPASAGRYHRHGQPALYLSPSAEWASIAVSIYLREDGLERVIVPVEIGAARVVDQRDPAACAALGIDCTASSLPWRPAIESGEAPASWHAADAAQAAGADGMIDPSRRIPGGWHVVLFRWNDLGGPLVSVCGAPVQTAGQAA
jgi:RES domain-containing protein